MIYGEGEEGRFGYGVFFFVFDFGLFFRFKGGVWSRLMNSFVNGRVIYEGGRKLYKCFIMMCFRFNILFF